MAAALVLAGPFGTGGDPWLWRLFYWCALIAIVDLFLLSLALNIEGRLSRLRTLPFSVGLVLLPLFLAVPVTAVVIVIDIGTLLVFCQFAFHLPVFFGARIVEACVAGTRVNVLEMYGDVLAICVLVGVRLFLCTGGTKAFVRPTAAIAKPGLRFLSRLPAHIGHEICYIQMQDHYLRAVARGGEAMILMSMRDAMLELEGVDGLQVHRSWWISLGDVEQIVRDGRKTLVVMTDGARIPVSETHQSALKERVGLEESDPSHRRRSVANAAGTS